MITDRVWASLKQASFVGMWLLPAFLASGSTTVAPSDYAVQASASMQTQPPQISLSWPADTTGLVTSYDISRRLPGAVGWTRLTFLDAEATNFTDENVAVNGEYEYEIKKYASGFQGYGYVLAGIEAPLEEARGTVILLVDATLASPLEIELTQLRSDLIGDGWQVIRHDVEPTASVPSVKALILADYLADPEQVQSVFLLGHIPVPYSGSIYPDGHNPAHNGAWPADVYYGEMDSAWTDTTVNNTNATSDRNWNVPGDGKFDQSYLPSDVELEVGRVDFSNLPSLATDEVELTRRYLQKDHAFRHKLFVADRRGYIADNFGVYGGAAFAVNGWRNFAAMFGASVQAAIPANGWFSVLSTNVVLWAYGCGGGNYTTVSGVCTTTDYNSNDPGAVFTFLFGSYLGDWDSTDNVMRGSLASPSYTLATAWAGRPHWFVHPMALGKTIGYCAKISQNCDGSTYRQLSAGMRSVHTALLGDPTLRLHPVAAPENLTASTASGSVQLTWSASAESVLGYLVYRADTDAGPFTRLTPDAVTVTSFTDDSPAADTQTYMVRAVTLETSGSGTYYNASQGCLATVTGIYPTPVEINDPRPIATLSTNSTASSSSSSTGGTSTSGEATTTGDLSGTGTTLGGATITGVSGGGSTIGTTSSTNSVPTEAGDSGDTNATVTTDSPVDIEGDVSGSTNNSTGITGRPGHLSARSFLSRAWLRRDGRVDYRHPARRQIVPAGIRTNLLDPAGVTEVQKHTSESVVPSRIRAEAVQRER